MAKADTVTGSGHAADIALLLESDGPVSASGGMSAWAARLAGALPEYRFAMVCLTGSRPAASAPTLSPWPDNVMRVDTHCLPGLAAPSPGDDDTSHGEAVAQAGGLYQPLWQLLRLAETVPAAQVYHALSSGHAGALGMLLAQQRRRPLLVSEPEAQGNHDSQRQASAALRRLCHAAAACIVAPDEAVRAELVRSVDAGRVCVIPPTSVGAYAGLYQMLRGPV